MLVRSRAEHAQSKAKTSKRDAANRRPAGSMLRAAIPSARNEPSSRLWARAGKPFRIFYCFEGSGFRASSIGPLECPVGPSGLERLF